MNEVESSQHSPYSKMSSQAWECIPFACFRLTAARAQGKKGEEDGDRRGKKRGRENNAVKFGEYRI